MCRDPPDPSDMINQDIGNADRPRSRITASSISLSAKHADQNGVGRPHWKKALDPVSQFGNQALRSAVIILLDRIRIKSRDAKGVIIPPTIQF